MQKIAKIAFWIRRMTESALTKIHHVLLKDAGPNLFLIL